MDRKSTEVCMSGQDLLVAKSALATKVWNTFALESSINLDSLSTLKFFLQLGYLPSCMGLDFVRGSPV